MTDDDARWQRKIAARKALATEADDLFVFLAELDSEEATHECTAARAEVFRWVSRHPRYGHSAQAKVFAETE